MLCNCFSFSFSPSQLDFGRTALSSLANFSSYIIKEARDQDLTHLLDTLKGLSLKSVSQAVIYERAAHDTA